MTRYYSPTAEEFGTNTMTKQEFEIRERIVAVMKRYTQEMEGYSYFGSNPGIAEDNYEDVADEIMTEFGMGGDWNDVTKVEPQELKQVLVTDGEEFRVLHREEGAWAFTVSPCDRTAMKWWKELK